MIVQLSLNKLAEITSNSRRLQNKLKMNSLIHFKNPKKKKSKKMKIKRLKKSKKLMLDFCHLIQFIV